MIQSKLNWNGNVAEQQVFNGGLEALKRITEFFTEAVKAALNVPNTGERRRRKRTTKYGAKGSTYTVYPNPSETGEPPHKITGHLRGGIIFEIDKDKLVSRVGLLPNIKYGVYLEYGTKKMGERSFLKRTLDNVLPQLKVLAES